MNGFLKAVEWVNSQSVAPPRTSLFSFEFNEEAALKNSLILKKHDYDLEKAINSQPGTTVTYGSEIRPFEQLDVLLHNHKNYLRFRENSINGISYPITELDENTRINMVESQAKKGNHKSTDTKEAKVLVTKAMETDVKRGFGIIMTKQCAMKIKGAEIYPLGLQHQQTINERGEIIPKKRVTHDLSNNRRSKLSINQRVIEEEVPAVQFGFALSRVLHLIHHIRRRHPNKRILMNKVDIEKAYRRLHVSARIAAKCIALWELHNNQTEIAIALERLPFGSMPAPAEFSICSDITFDLANDLMNCDLWDPTTMASPLEKEIPPPKRLEDNIPFGEALPTDVHLPDDLKGGTDGYIDDGMNVVLDSEENKEMVKRAEQNIPFALHLQFRPHAGDLEPIPRGEMASIPKLIAEGLLTEVIIFLGWEINTRTFEIALPDDKYKAWSAQITKIENAKTATYAQMSKLIGRLNHVAFIIPAGRHFMNRLRRIEKKAERNSSARITREAKKDLRLWMKFLTQANNGISINNIVFRKPTSQSLSDSCETGIGGYGFNSGVAWRYQLTEDEQVSLDINQKEFLASTINQKIQLMYDDSPHPCSNDLTDNTSATAWMHKSNFDPDSHPINNEIALWCATNLMARQASSYSQHLPGTDNDIADSLSRDFHLNNNQLIALFKHEQPPYLPEQEMQFIELPEEITSWIASLARLQTKKRERKWEHTPSTLAHGIVGWSGSNTSEEMTPIFNSSHVRKEYGHYVPSYTRSDAEISLPTEIKLRGKPRRRPSIMWRRPSSQVVGMTHE